MVHILLIKGYQNTFINIIINSWECDRKLNWYRSYNFDRRNNITNYHYSELQLSSNNWILELKIIAKFEIDDGK